MEDLADEECVVQIFIRCPGHLWDDVKFGQIGGAGILAGDARSCIWIRPERAAAAAKTGHVCGRCGGGR